MEVAIDPLNPIRELFSFSPFGLCCRECGSKAKITFDERCILRHLKKHSLNISVAIVRCYVKESCSEIKLARTSGSIQPYRSDDKTYTLATPVVVEFIFNYEKTALSAIVKKRAVMF